MSGGFLLATNVPSELTRAQPAPRVTQWLEETDDELMHTSVIMIGELCKGIKVYPEGIATTGCVIGLRASAPVVFRPNSASDRGDFGTVGNS